MIVDNSSGIKLLTFLVPRQSRWDSTGTRMTRSVTYLLAYVRSLTTLIIITATYIYFYINLHHLFMLFPILHFTTHKPLTTNPPSSTSLVFSLYPHSFPSYCDSCYWDYMPILFLFTTLFLKLLPILSYFLILYQKHPVCISSLGGKVG